MPLSNLLYTDISFFCRLRAPTIFAFTVSSLVSIEFYPMLRMVPNWDIVNSRVIISDHIYTYYSDQSIQPRANTQKFIILDVNYVMLRIMKM